MNWTLLLEFFYILMGLMLFAAGVIVLQDQTNDKRVGSAAFWFITGFLFAAGRWLPDLVSGILVVLLATLTLFKQVKAGTIEVIPQLFRDEGAKALKNKIFLPPVIIAISAFIYATILPKILPAAAKSLAGNLSVCFAGVTGVIAALILTKAAPKYIAKDSGRMIIMMGPASILPQLLAALGAVFAAAKVGDLISHMLVNIIPENNRLAGVVAYCLGMMIFTVIMGNGFAAFTVITIGIGIPFVINLGANPAIVGAMALTAGFCGTLLTPMAANFNIVPANLLETKSQYSIIKYQIPFALALLLVHIVLMYIFGFNF